jgi:hypothetical protein
LRRGIFVLAVAAAMVMAMLVAVLPAVADAGGYPDKNACFGQFVGEKAQVGDTPPQLASGGNPGVFLQFVHSSSGFSKC